MTVAAFFGITAALVGLLAVRGLMEAASGGDPYTVIPVVDTNTDPNIVETTITALPAAVDIGNGVTASVLTFNGTIPGPQFRLKVGDTVIVHFVNNIARATGIHWHGIELNNASDGTPLTQNQVAPGDTFLYKFKVTRPGIYWYHPHHHSSTNQVFKGLYGSMIVADPSEAALVSAGTLPTAALTKTLVLGDLTVCKAPGTNDAATFSPSLPHVSGSPLFPQAPPTPRELCETAPIDEDGNRRGAFASGDVPNTQKAGTTGRVNEGQTVITNGINVGARAGTPSAPGALASGAKLLDVQAGQGLRLQIINAATTRYFRLRLTTSAGVLVPLVRVGGQGGLLDRAIVEGGISSSGFDTKYTAGEALLAPGDRVDVVAAIPSSATGVLTLWTEDFKRAGTGFVDIPTVPVAHFNIAGSAAAAYTISAGTPLRVATGSPVESLGAATATLLNPALFTPAKVGLASPNIELTLVGLASLGINNVIGTHDTHGDYTTMHRPASSRYAPAAPIGSTLELTVQNLTFAHHPFHLHGFSIQPLDLTRPGEPAYTFPYREFIDTIDIPANYTLRFRVRLDDRPLMDGTTPGGALGRWVLHCHIFFHAVFGMISEFNVVAANGNERPHVNADDTLIQGTTGTILTMRGSYFDRDGDPVSLSASSGTITPDGDGSHWTWTRAGGSSGLVYVTATDSGGRRDQVAFEVVVTLASGPTLTLARSSARFAAINSGGTLSAQTSAQTFTLNQSGAGTVTWTATANRPWLTVTPSAGTGSGAFTLSINNTGNVLPTSGRVIGTVTIASPAASNSPQILSVTLDVYTSTTSTAAPFGSWDTPISGTTGVTGALSVTGWALDDLEVARVTIYRASVAPEVLGQQIYIGDALLVSGARPDVETANPTVPFNDRAGWGYQLLTNMLPGGGNGTYTLYAYGVDREGRSTLLGEKTVTCSNALATKPFGAIDTPAPGAIIGGITTVHAWALTPLPKAIPTDGSTMTMFIDGVSVGTLTYNQFRPDIAGLFPGYANTTGAGASRTLDTTPYTNGVHTISLSVFDNAGVGEGIGSRYFTIQNATSVVAGSDADARAEALAHKSADDRAETLAHKSARVGQPFPPPPEATARLAEARFAREGGRAADGRAQATLQRGFNEDAPLEHIIRDADGTLVVDARELERLVIHLSPDRPAPGATFEGYLRVGDQLRPLPIGSTLDARQGLFRWAPGLGFLGRYDLVFVRIDRSGIHEHIRVHVMLHPQHTVPPAK